ncbi:MAG: hypothetical protein LBC17_02035 [Lactobacillaceae bacterium]|jgi:hypothetical protein|nr:hypothetical protein [Lactobacillaceae bacterium]
MGDLRSNKNIQLNLAQASYSNRPQNFASNQEFYDFGDGKKWYLQETINNPKTGYTAYVVTNKKFAKSATQGYYVVRGSDGIDYKNPDWWNNNLPFAIENKAVIQAKDFTNSFTKEKNKFPNIQKWDLVGHSLATMVIVTGLSKMDLKTSAKVGQVTLFNGPDISNSLSKQEKQNLNLFQDRITYYLNPDDPVSVFNRNNSNQIGNIHYIDGRINIGSPYIKIGDTHDFSEYQFDNNGQIKLIDNDFSIKEYIHWQNIIDNYLLDYLKKNKITSKTLQNFMQKISNKNVDVEKVILEMFPYIKMSEILFILNQYNNAKEQFQITKKINKFIASKGTIRANPELINDLLIHFENSTVQFAKNIDYIFDTAKNSLKEIIYKDISPDFNIRTDFYNELMLHWSTQKENSSRESVSQYKKDSNKIIGILRDNLANILKIDNTFTFDTNIFTKEINYH